MNVKRRKNTDDAERREKGIAAVASTSSLMVVTIVRILVMSAHCGYKTMYRLRERIIVEREQIFPLLFHLHIFTSIKKKHEC